MIIIDKRIENKYCVDVECFDNIINQKTVESWISPFFSVQKENIDMLKIIAKIKIIKEVQQEYIYCDNIFYININMPIKKILYTMISILRMLYKYIALEEGYQNLHAACLEYNYHGMLIAAERNQGKTTMILNAMQDKDFLLLANDQVMYNVTNNQVLGYPAAVGIRRNSCDDEKQRQINEKALWFIEDPFQVQPKPVVYIKDLSKIYQCDIVESTKLDFLVSYEKSMKIDELKVTNIGTVKFPINEIDLPLEKTYKDELLKSCEYSVSYYIGTEYEKRTQVKYNKEISIKQINVKCGINRINDMLCEIKYILK